MKNHWSVQTNELKKNPDKFAIWKLEQRINWGIGDGKIKRLELVKYWDQIEIDPFKRKALSLALF